MSDVFDDLEESLIRGITDQDVEHRVAMLDILTLLAEPDAFLPIIRDVLNTFRYNYYHGDESQREHVRYILNYLLGDEIENSRTRTNNNPPS